MNNDASHLGLINKIDEKTGASVGMYRDIQVLPVDFYRQYLAPSDDKRPMTGTWYRSTIDPNILGKVTEIAGHMVTVIFTGGGVDRCTINEFADSWELN